jgi:hypothetical protein
VLVAAGLDAAVVPFVLEQADSEARATAATHAIMRFFIFTMRNYTIAWSYAIEFNLSV